ncbi:hypothetical protein L1887_29526 [Cichorium endivia]|nr:hypothetical protein L1887_29526 [Cichorium endivia]
MILLSSTSSLGLHLVDYNEPAIYDMAYLIINLPPLSEREKGDVHITVAGTSNGIVLLVQRIHSTSHMILYNPLTRASKRVQDSPYPFNNVDASTYAYGFGYGATPDDLKFVRIEVHESFDGDWGTYHVFDLKKNVWSTPQDFPPRITFTMVRPEQGVENSWSKVCSFKVDPEGDYLCNLASLYILDHGRFLMMDDYGQLFIYETSNLSRKLLTRLEGDQYFQVIHGIEYVESLVSPSDICTA